MPGRSTVSDSEDPIEQLIAGLTVEELREVVSAAVDRHGDVERQVRLIASRGAGDLAQLRAEVDRGLRTRRFLGFGESAGWACAARPIVAELEKSADESPSMALVELLQRAVGHVVKVILHADDSDGLIGELARELLARYEFIRVAEAMRELGLHNDALAWAKRGIAHTSGWQVAQLYDLACDVHDAREEPLEVLALRRAQHERMPSSSTHRALRTAADAHGAWQLEQDAAGAALQWADPRGLVDALLGDDELGLAWSAATAAPRDALGSDLWLRLAERSERERPADARAVYQRVAGEVLERADRRAYRSAARILQRAQATARAAGELDTFEEYLARRREQHRRRPTLIEILDNAKLG